MPEYYDLRNNWIDAGIVLKERVVISRVEIITADFNISEEFLDLAGYSNVQYMEDQLRFEFIFRSITPVITTVQEGQFS